jgi:hypothetical protein
MGVQNPHDMKLDDVSRLVRRSQLVATGLITPDYEYTTNQELLKTLQAAILEGKFDESKIKQNNEEDNDNDENNDDEICSETDQLIPITFTYSFLKNYPRWLESLEKLLTKPNHKLQAVVFVPPMLTLTQIFSPNDEKYMNKVVRDENENMFPEEFHPKMAFKRHGHAQVTFLIPECCDVLGPAVWFFAGLAAPSIMWRLQSLLLALEAREKIVDSIKNYYNNNDHDSSHELIGVGVPSPLLMLQTLTPRLSNDSLDYERLEIIGDALLKLIITVEIFRIYPYKHEGFLTLQRCEFISNQHLHNVSRYHYILSIDFFIIIF